MSVTAIQPDSHGQKKSRSPVNLEFIYVQPDELHDYWETVKPGLQKVIKYGDDGIPEDFYHSIKIGQSYLHVFKEDEKYIGFTITMPTVSPKGPVLHVHAMYSDNQNQRFHDVVNDKLTEWGKAMNAWKITFFTTRKGWEKVGNKLGFKPAMTIHERVIK